MSTTTPKKQYATRDHEAQCEYYVRHLIAMTAEGLHSKSDIAGELAHRDILITEMLAALKGALRVADRKTVEFDAVRAAIAKAEGTP